MDRSVIHYVVTGHKFGTYDNIGMLQFLEKKGFKVNLKDSAGKTPIDHAAKYKTSQIYKHLVKLGQKE